VSRPDADAVRRAAWAAAEGIAAAAEPTSEGCTWQAEILVGVDGDDPLIGHGDVGPTLYDGTAGIALALAAAAVTVPDPAVGDRLARTARGAVATALAGGWVQLEDDRLGLFDGATGIALAAATTGRLLGEAGLADDGRRLAGAVALRTGGIAELDLLGGLAGTALGLLAVAGVTGGPPPLEVCSAAARRLVDRAEPQVWGTAWPPAADETVAPPLLGLAHGTAGIALALAEIAALTGDPPARATALAACEHERAWYDADRVAWPDLREHDPSAEPAGWMSAWCHGAIGIGLCRLRMTALSDDPLLPLEASAALQSARDRVVSAGTALRDGTPQDCSPCHGLSGTVELLLAAHRAFGLPDHLLAAGRVATLLLEQRAHHGSWPCGLPGAGEIPTLMTGTSGIVLSLLAATGASPIPTPLLPGPYSMPRS
jgi:lantibiotic modifying enzyme